MCFHYGVLQQIEAENSFLRMCLPNNILLHGFTESDQAMIVPIPEP